MPDDAAAIAACTAFTMLPAPQHAAALVPQDFVEVFNRVVFDEDTTAHERV